MIVSFLNFLDKHHLALSSHRFSTLIPPPTYDDLVAIKESFEHKMCSGMAQEKTAANELIIPAHNTSCRAMGSSH